MKSILFYSLDNCWPINVPRVSPSTMRDKDLPRLELLVVWFLSLSYTPGNLNFFHYLEQLQILHLKWNGRSADGRSAEFYKALKMFQQLGISAEMVKNWDGKLSFLSTNLVQDLKLHLKHESDNAVAYEQLPNSHIFFSD